MQGHVDEDECDCGHMLDEHAEGGFSPCTVCKCAAFDPADEEAW